MVGSLQTVHNHSACIDISGRTKADKKTTDWKGPTNIVPTLGAEPTSNNSQATMGWGCGEIYALTFLSVSDTVVRGQVLYVYLHEQELDRWTVQNYRV